MQCETLLTAVSIHRFFLEVKVLFLWTWLAQTCILLIQIQICYFLKKNSCNLILVELEEKYLGIISWVNYMTWSLT